MSSSEIGTNEKTPTDRFFDLFWHLGNEDFSIRSKATLSLLNTLELSHKNKGKGSVDDSPSDIKFKGVNMDLNYTLDRLIKGLLSKRSSAREGFALALSEVLYILRIKILPYSHYKRSFAYSQA